MALVRAGEAPCGSKAADRRTQLAFWLSLQPAYNSSLQFSIQAPKLPNGVVTRSVTVQFEAVLPEFHRLR
jgi:hypothetical protein